MKKDPLLFITHMEECIEDIEIYMSGKSRDDFLADKMLQDAVVRKLMIIGEAVKNLPAEFTSKYPKVPWSDIARTRDKLVHDYFGVDLKLTFDIVAEDLPELKKQIARILKR